MNGHVEHEQTAAVPDDFMRTVGLDDVEDSYGPIELEDRYIGQQLGYGLTTDEGIEYEMTDRPASIEEINYEDTDIRQPVPAPRGRGGSTFENAAYNVDQDSTVNKDAGYDGAYADRNTSIEWGTYERNSGYIPPLPSKAPVGEISPPKSSGAPKPEPRTKAAIIRPNVAKREASPDKRTTKKTNNNNDVGLPRQAQLNDGHLCPRHLAIKVWLPVTIGFSIAFFIIGIVSGIFIKTSCPKPQC